MVVLFSINNLLIIAVLQYKPSISATLAGRGWFQR